MLLSQTIASHRSQYPLLDVNFFDELPKYALLNASLQSILVPVVLSCKISDAPSLPTIAFCSSLSWEELRLLSKYIANWDCHRLL
uniref:F-box protein At5g52880 n=1 Tax=Rhizophora mucronata TaxID=61149 RepID=A0A2P2K3H7_RHIMU